MSSLPSNWVVAPLGDLLTEVLGGGTPDKSKAENFRGDIPFMTVKDMHSRFIDDTQDHISQEALASSASRVIPADTLVIASRMSLGKIARPTRAVAINQDLKALFLQQGVSKPYIEYAWRANAARIQAMGTGTTVKGIRLEDIRGLEVPVAPAAEQTRIADQLDTLLARIQACQDRLEAIPALLKRFRQAVLSAAVRGELTADWRESDGERYHPDGIVSWPIPTSWRWAAAGEECGFITKGTTPAKEKMHSAAGAVPYVKVYNLTFDGVLDFTIDPTFVDVPTHRGELKRSIALPGDVLMNIVGPPLGKVSIVPDTHPEWNINQAIARFRPGSTVRSEFLAACLLSPGLVAFATSKAKATAGQWNLTLEICRALPLSVPSLNEQDEIVRRIRLAMHHAALIEARHAAARSRAQRLVPLTLAKAFRGELVPQDPNDEPASALLARIATQRNAPTNGATARAPRRSRPPRAPKETAAMTKSRQDDDVMGQPYLADHLRRIGTPASAETLFKAAELPVADFYKQLAWEVTQGHVKDNQTTLEPGHAAG